MGKIGKLSIIERELGVIYGYILNIMKKCDFAVFISK